MKTGSVAKLFGIDPKTATGWVDEFPEFFSESAKGDGLTQRSYLPEDLIVLNTIKAERAVRTDVETIRAKLASGHRDTALPPEQTLNRESSLAVYGQLRTLEAQLEDERREKEQLWRRTRELEETVERLNKEKTAEMQRLLKETSDEYTKKFTDQIATLHEQIGDLKATIRMLKERYDLD
jgi:DNA-binding transcriptional MerR regulator